MLKTSIALVSIQAKVAEQRWVGHTVSHSRRVCRMAGMGSLSEWWGAGVRHAELAPQNLGGQGVQEAERGPPTQPLLTPSAPQIKFLNH